MTLTFDLLTSKPNQFIFVSRCTNDKSLAKIHQNILTDTVDITETCSLGRSDGQKHGQRRAKHTASGSGSFKKPINRYLRTECPCITEWQPKLIFFRRQTVAKQLDGFGREKWHGDLAGEGWQTICWVPAGTYHQLQRLKQDMNHLRSIWVMNHTL